jgi:hypothetical protein
VRETDLTARSGTAVNVYDDGAGVVGTAMGDGFQSARQHIARNFTFPGNDSKYSTHAIFYGELRTSILTRRLTACVKLDSELPARSKVAA